MEKKSRIRVTYNEACILQNQVINEYRSNIMYCSYFFFCSIFELNLMIKEI